MLIVHYLCEGGPLVISLVDAFIIHIGNRPSSNYLSQSEKIFLTPHFPCG